MFTEWGYRNSNSRCSLPNKYSKYSTSLNEITNKVFEDLLKGKANAKFDELGVIDLDQKSNVSVLVHQFIIMLKEHFNYLF